jgi:hypothetical protein
MVNKTVDNKFVMLYTIDMMTLLKNLLKPNNCPALAWSRGLIMGNFSQGVGS